MSEKFEFNQNRWKQQWELMACKTNENDQDVYNYFNTHLRRSIRRAESELSILNLQFTEYWKNDWYLPKEGV